MARTGKVLQPKPRVELESREAIAATCRGPIGQGRDLSSSSSLKQVPLVHVQTPSQMD